jgi:pyruvate ferredoxin oxidoreductase gamma subunit
LIDSSETAEVWRDRLALDCPILVLPKVEATGSAALQRVAVACAGAAARLTGVISRENLIEAVGAEYSQLDGATHVANREAALEAYDQMVPHQGLVRGRDSTGPAEASTWIDLPFDEADISAPSIHAALTSVKVRTGLWRTMRPVVDYDRCNRCWWVCSTFCPDDAISVSDSGQPVIDYDTCKGCLICVAQCPPHAIEAVPEGSFASVEMTEGTANLEPVDPGKREAT